MPAPCNALATSMPPCSPPSSARWHNDLPTTNRTGQMSHQNPPHPRWGRSGCLLSWKDCVHPSLSVPEKGDLSLLCSLGVALVDIGQWLERQNEHLYTCCNENSDSTGRIVPTLR